MRNTLGVLGGSHAEGSQSRVLADWRLGARHVGGAPVLPMSWAASSLGGQAAGIPRISLVLTAVPFLFALLAGLILIVFHDDLTRRWPEDEISGQVVDARLVLALGLVLIGTWLLVSELSGMFGAFASALQRMLESAAAGEPMSLRGWLAPAIPMMVVRGFMAAIGRVFIIRARWCAQRLAATVSPDAQQAHRADAVS